MSIPATREWVSSMIAKSIRVSEGGGDTSTKSLNDMTDVIITSPTNKQVLTYNASTNMWENKNPEGGGGGGTTVIANPEGEATDELEKIQIGNNIYSLPSNNLYAAYVSKMKNGIISTLESYETAYFDSEITFNDILIKFITHVDGVSYTTEKLAADCIDNTFIIKGHLDITVEMTKDSIKVTKYGGTDWKEITVDVYTLTANSGGGTSIHKYSETEQVVGEWIDGEPIYEIVSDEVITGVTILDNKKILNKYVLTYIKKTLYYYIFKEGLGFIEDSFIKVVEGAGRDYSYTNDSIISNIVNSSNWNGNLYSTNKVNITNYNTLHIDVEVTDVYTGWTQIENGFGLLSSIPDYGTPITSYDIYKIIPMEIGVYSFDIDIVNPSSNEYYIAVKLANDSIKITNLYLYFK